MCLFKGLKGCWNIILEGLRFNLEYVSQRINFPILIKLATQHHFKADGIARAFECCGLCPWNADAIDYSKCLSFAPKKATPSSETGQFESETSAHQDISDGEASQSFVNEMEMSSLWNQDLLLHSEADSREDRFQDPILVINHTDQCNFEHKASTSFRGDKVGFTADQEPTASDLTDDHGLVGKSTASLGSLAHVSSLEEEKSVAAPMTEDNPSLEVCSQTDGSTRSMLDRDGFMQFLPKHLVQKFIAPDYKQSYQKRINELENENILFQVFQHFRQTSPESQLPHTRSGLPMPPLNKRKGASRKQVETLPWIIGSQQYKLELEAIARRKEDQERLKKQLAENRKKAQQEKKEAAAAKKEVLAQKRAETAQRKADAAKKREEQKRTRNKSANIAIAPSSNTQGVSINVNENSPPSLLPLNSSPCCAQDQSLPVPASKARGRKKKEKTFRDLSHEEKQAFLENMSFEIE